MRWATIATPSRADAPRRRPVAAVRHAIAAEAPPTHWAGRQKARAALASATRLMSETYDVVFVVEVLPSARFAPFMERGEVIY